MHIPLRVFYMKGNEADVRACVTESRTVSPRSSLSGRVARLALLAWALALASPYKARLLSPAQAYLHRV